MPVEHAISGNLLLANLKMDDEEDDSDGDAHRADHQVGDAQEGVLTTQPWRRRQNHALSTVEWRHRIGCAEYSERNVEVDPTPISVSC